MIGVESGVNKEAKARTWRSSFLGMRLLMNKNEYGIVCNYNHLMMQTFLA